MLFTITIFSNKPGFYHFRFACPFYLFELVNSGFQVGGQGSSGGFGSRNIHQDHRSTVHRNSTCSGSLSCRPNLWLLHGMGLKENRRRRAEYQQVKNEWQIDYQDALKAHVSSRVSTANTLQRKMVGIQPVQQVIQQVAPIVQPTGMSTYIRQAFESLCAEGIGFDPLNIRPSNVVERLEAGGITGIKDGMLRPTIQRIKVTLLNEILQSIMWTGYPSCWTEKFDLMKSRMTYCWTGKPSLAINNTLPIYCHLTSSMECEKFLSNTASSKTKNPYFDVHTTVFIFPQTNRGRISPPARYLFAMSWLNFSVCSA